MVMVTQRFTVWMDPHFIGLFPPVSGSVSSTPTELRVKVLHSPDTSARVGRGSSVHDLRLEVGVTRYTAKEATAQEHEAPVRS